MARLASQERLGYYPTPETIVKQIKQCLHINPGCRLFDPCCGKGEALALLAKDESNVETLGVELEKGRFLEAEQVLDKVLWADSITETDIGSQFADILFLNPPYDHGEGDMNQIKERLEYDFLSKYYKALSRKGLLIYIVPVSTLKRQNVRTLLSRLSDLEIHRFPDDEFESFKQIVVMGRKKTVTGKTAGENEAALFKFAYGDLMNIPTTDDMVEKYSFSRIPVEKTSKTNYIFKALHIEPDELLSLTADLKKILTGKSTPPALSDVKPLMPLRQGHLAMLLAAGYINGELKQGGTHLIIKGAVKKVAEIRDESTETHEVTVIKQKSSIIVRALDMASGEIENIQ